MSFIQVEEQTIGMRHDLIVRRAELTRARAAEASAAQKLAGIGATFRREALDAFNEADATFRQRQQDLARQSRTVLRALNTECQPGPSAISFQSVTGG